jgi:hypothetical protein
MLNAHTLEQLQALQLTAMAATWTTQPQNAELTALSFDERPWGPPWRSPGFDPSIRASAHALGARLAGRRSGRHGVVRAASRGRRRLT